MNKCEHYEFDDYFGKCSDCNATRQEIVADSATPDMARYQAINWQKWAGNENMSYAELAEWQAVFTELGNRFGLTDEFKENGVI